MFTLGIISLVLSAISTAVGVVSNIQQAKASADLQRAQAKMQSENLRQQADQEEQDQLQRSMVERRQNARKLAAAEAQYAASGVSLSGTPTLSLATMSEEQELEVSMQESASNQKRHLLLTDADNALSMGTIGADMTQRAGYINGIGQGLSGAADLFGKGYTIGKKEGTF